MTGNLALPFKLLLSAFLKRILLESSSPGEGLAAGTNQAGGGRMGVSPTGNRQIFPAAVGVQIEPIL